MHHHLVAAVVHAAAGRLLVDDLNLSEEKRRSIRKRLSRLEKWTELASDLDLDSPLSWINVATKSAKKAFDANADCESRWEWFERNGFERHPGTPQFVLGSLLEGGSSEIAYADERTRLHLVDAGSFHFCVADHSGYGDRYRLWRPADASPALLEDAISRMVWERWGEGAVELDWINEEAGASPVPLGDDEFIGPLSSLVSEWKNYLDENVSRTVLLNGDTGTGKTTLAKQAARSLSERTVFLTDAFCSECSASMWGSVLDVLEPSMVFMDEVDKVGEDTLRSRLKMFEEDRCEVPLVILASNDLDEIPRQMLRPGRIDQTIEMGKPSRSTRRDIVRNLGEREGVDLCKSDVCTLASMMDDLSAAHARDMIRRIKVEGTPRLREEERTFDSDLIGEEGDDH